MKTNLIKTLLISLFIYSCTSAQKNNEKTEFEGYVVYTVQVEVGPNNRFTNEEFQEMIGDTLIMYYKQGKMLSVSNGNDLDKELYISTSNTTYMVFKNKDTLYTIPCDKPKRKFLSQKALDEVDTIQGYACKSFVQTFENGNNSLFFYSPDLYINPDFFKNNIAFGENERYAEFPGLGLKMKRSYSVFTTLYTATKINKTSLPDSLFSLPNYPTVTLK